MTNTQDTVAKARIQFRTGNRFAEALAVQDACNPIAIVNLLKDVVRDCQDDPKYSGMPYITNDPAFCMIVDKLHDMTGRPSQTPHGKGSYGELYSACVELGNNPDTPRHTLSW